MKNYHVKGGLKRGSAIVLAACFLLGSSITSLAAGDGVVDAYEDLAFSTSAWAGGEEYIEMNEDMIALREIAEEYGLDPDSIIIMDDGIMPLSDDDGWNITWTVPPRRTYMTTGFYEEKGDKLAIALNATPDDIQFRVGIKDPDNIMWYIEDEDKFAGEVTIQQKGRHYFFVSNWDEERDLHVNATLYI